jgi:predicted N-acyltransferase
MISENEWELAGQTNPFLSFKFHNALRESRCIGEEVGWSPIQFQSPDKKAFLNTFLKTHSWGEFIFDWSWADAYEKHGLSYYPKFTSMIPFTPVTAPHFCMKNWDEDVAKDLLLQFDQLFNQSDASSAHFLFIPEIELALFQRSGYLIRESIQYHFFNTNLVNFEDFLMQLKSKKAKNLKKERSFPNLQFVQLTGDQLQQEHAMRMYYYYLSTIETKGSYPYLNEAFFLILFSSFKDHILFIEAIEENTPVGGALFFYDEDKLYGRYWGASKFIENLHFELCYYQGIDFCLKNKLKIFEGGAQGEHKISRGFRPVRIYSAHKFKHLAFHKAVDKFLQIEKIQITNKIHLLSQRLPFKDLELEVF